ncbi:MAG: hypothetical protein SR2Q5_02545 [Quinella sp. 2Q5]|nr:hypothetical protein [Quinella sp. 2Q5]
MHNIWWGKTDGPRRFLERAAEFLSNGCSVVLCLPKDLPWRQTMRETLYKLLDEKFSPPREIVEVDAQEIPRTPPKYVMQEFCANKAGFHPYGDKAHAEFLADKADEGISLNDTCLWVRDAANEPGSQWFRFVADYHGFLGERRGGVFLLEVNANFDGRACDGVKILSFDGEIGDYDYFAFNILLAAESSNDTKLMKQYLAELVTGLTGCNAELAAACMERRDELLAEPRAVFRKILAQGDFAAATDDDIDQPIWVAQMKLIFPLVESFRRRVLLKKYFRPIAAALPCYSSWGERIETPEQAELGVLVHLVKLRKLWFDKPDWDELLYYRDLRNRLAHLEILPLEEVRRVFEKS